jgi:hypothetical protein
MIGSIPECRNDLGGLDAIILFKQPATLYNTDFSVEYINTNLAVGAIDAILKGFDDYTAANVDATTTEYAGSGRTIIGTSQKIGGNLIFAGDPCIAKVAANLEGQQRHAIFVTKKGYAIGKDTASRLTIATIPITFGASSVASVVFKNTDASDITIAYSLGDMPSLVKRLRFIAVDFDTTLVAGRDIVKFYDMTTTTARLVSDCDGTPYNVTGTPTLLAKFDGNNATINLTSSDNGVLQYTTLEIIPSGHTFSLKISGDGFISDWQRIIVE